MIADPSRENALAVLEQLHKAMGGFVSDRDFIDMLRVMQVAVHRGEIKPDDVPGAQAATGRRVSRRRSAHEPRADAAARLSAGIVDHRSLSRVSSSRMPRISTSCTSPCTCGSSKAAGPPSSAWSCSPSTKRPSQARGAAATPATSSMPRATSASELNEEESRLVLAQGRQAGPTRLSALSTSCRQQLDAETLRHARPRSMASWPTMKGDSIQRLQVGIVAVLARSGDADSMTYLRKVWDEVPSGDRRSPWAWPSSQPAKTGPISSAACRCWSRSRRKGILHKLTDVDQAPEEAGALSAGDPARPEDAARRIRKWPKPLRPR